MRLWSITTLLIFTAIVLAPLGGLLPIDTVLLRLMLSGAVVGSPILIRDVWRFNVRPAVVVEGRSIVLYSRGRTSQFNSSRVVSTSLVRSHLNDYLTLELDGGIEHRVAVQIDDREHRSSVESWMARIARPA